MSVTNISEIFISKMTSDDIENVIAIEAEAYGEHHWSKSSFYDEMQNNLAKYYVAKAENGELVGSKLVDIDKVYSSSNVGEDSPFRISGGGYSSLGCRTKFADVKLYTALMTEAEAKAKYDAEKANYGIEDTTEQPGTDEPGCSIFSANLVLTDVFSEISAAPARSFPFCASIHAIRRA